MPWLGATDGVCPYCRSGHENLCDNPVFTGYTRDGGYATHVVADGVACDVLLLLAYPLHPPGKPERLRTAHLERIMSPMLFLQGSRDALADLTLLRPVIERLGDRASLTVFEDADHSFHVPARSGGNDAAVRRALLDALAAWISGHA